MAILLLYTIPNELYSFTAPMHRLYLCAYGCTDRLKPRWFWMKLQFMPRTKQFSSASDTPGKTMRQPLLPKRQWMKIYVGCVTVNAVFVINQFSLHTYTLRFCNSVQFRKGGGVWVPPQSYAILSIYAIEQQSFAFGFLLHPPPGEGNICGISVIVMHSIDNWLARLTSASQMHPASHI